MKLWHRWLIVGVGTAVASVGAWWIHPGLALVVVGAALYLIGGFS